MKDKPGCNAGAEVPEVCGRCGVVHEQKPYNEKDVIEAGLRAIMEAEDNEWRALADEKMREMGIDPIILDTETLGCPMLAEEFEKMRRFRERFAVKPEFLQRVALLAAEPKYKPKPHQTQIIDMLRGGKPVIAKRMVNGVQIDCGPTVNIEISDKEPDFDSLLAFDPNASLQTLDASQLHALKLHDQFVAAGGKSEYLHFGNPNQRDGQRTIAAFGIDTGNGSGIRHAVMRMGPTCVSQIPKQRPPLEGEHLPKEDWGKVLFTVDSYPDFGSAPIDGVVITDFKCGSGKFRALDEAVRVRDSKGPRSWAGPKGDRGPPGPVAPLPGQIVGPTGKPKRDKKKSKAQKLARKGNRK
jgi:hypothetical protein